ncbi:AraC family transcriptional regulator [Tamlana sp. 2201CG12-4]|uniref:AraC family transcriptional regulator n=1 Tax=Tamlana sp. 2201CG12-4 TaxID=3112582 RepID=UPI002DB7C773|nr:AraC family transcriptional regulator [Tamlana sp. 2201CG12-4]MEC3908250.1 AraC family transcriptional regulator [Tamlana sp. 2201CG12-4]
MKPQLVNRSNNLYQTFSDKINSYPYFFKVWHFHPETELVLIRKSTGTFFIGDQMERFKPGDLFLIGSNIPHLLLNDEEYFDGDSELIAEAWVIHLDKEFMNNNLFDLPETAKLKPFLNDAKLGIKFSKKSALMIKNIFGELFGKPDYEKIIALLRMFQVLADDKKNYIIMSSPAFSDTYREGRHHRMVKVYDYIYGNFRKNIELKELASIANMNNSAFCRYFKKVNKKTVSRYVNELRIGYACKLLQEDVLNISEICYDSGFNNISNFNRQFRNIKNVSPSEYSKKYN